jgi:pimeloyl-ACP methyl ester carboxylesterase
VWQRGDRCTQQLEGPLTETAQKGLLGTKGGVHGACCRSHLVGNPAHGQRFDAFRVDDGLRGVEQGSGGGLAVHTLATHPQGESGGAPAPLDEVVVQVHELLGSLAVDRPIVVGHSMSGGLATLYAAAYASRGLVVVDNGPDIRPIAQLVQQLEPALRGFAFPEVWRTFEDSIGLELVPEPVRSLVLESHEVKQEVVVGYWETLLRTDPGTAGPGIQRAWSR